MLEIQPCKAVNASVRLPGSKYIANRLIPMCALASSASRLDNIVDNNDIQATIAGLSAMDYRLDLDGNCLRVQPRINNITNPIAINTAHSGTFSRFVAALAALQGVPVTIECSAKMATRPMEELFSALTELGVSIESTDQKLPATVTGRPNRSQCSLDAGRSSQFLSALLIIAPLLDNGIEIDLIGEQVSNAYVDMTVFWMARMGIEIERAENKYLVKAGQSYQGLTVKIPGDAVSASYFMGLAGISGGKITIQSFDFDSLQGESKFYKVLELMGMSFEKSDDQIIASCAKKLKGIEVDMSEMPDVVQTLAVMACFAEGTTWIKNIAHLAYKESNRIKDTATELIKTGIKVEFGIDYLKIEGGNPHGAQIDTYDDHRMAMSMALLGARVKGIQINDPQVVAKSFPHYWEMMSQCGLQSKSVS